MVGVLKAHKHRKHGLHPDGVKHPVKEGKWEKMHHSAYLARVFRPYSADNPCFGFNPGLQPGLFMPCAFSA